MKNVRISSFLGPYFPAFRVNTERHELFSQCGKIWTGKTPNANTFHAVINENIGMKWVKLYIHVYVMLCVICHRLYNLGSVKNTHGGTFAFSKVAGFRSDSYGK